MAGRTVPSKAAPLGRQGRQGAAEADDRVVNAAMPGGCWLGAAKHPLFPVRRKRYRRAALMTKIKAAGTHTSMVFTFRRANGQGRQMGRMKERVGLNRRQFRNLGAFSTKRYHKWR